MRSTALACLLLASCASRMGTPELGTAPMVVRDMNGETHDVDATLDAGQPVALVFWQAW